MQNDFQDININQLENIAEVFNQCTDAFVFVFDLQADTYYISEQAMTLFSLPGKRFSHATATLETIVFREDRALLANELDLLRSGKKDSHNLEYRWVNKSGKNVWISCRGRLIHSGDENRPVLIGRIAIIDEDDKKDFLTSMATESQLRKDFSQVWKKHQKVSGFIIKIDIDNLGTINEQYGIHTGDFVLSLVADCVKRACNGIAKPYKLNSDEMLCLNLSGCSAVDAQRVYQGIKRNIAETEQKIDYDVVFTVSAGAVAFYNDDSQLDDLIKKVNYTVIKAKSKGRNNLTLFNAGEYLAHLRKLDLQDKLRDSIKNNFRGFQLFYQPVIDAKNLFLDKGKSVFNVIGAEALLRWSCPEYGMIPPDEFIPILEQTGLIIPVGRWILLTGFNQCREWNRVQKDFHMSVNVSYIQVKKSDIVTDVQMALERSGVKPENITLELTESGYIDSTSELQRLMDSFTALGVKVDIDDFGTGYSNLRYLQYLHAYTLKLDYSFVHKATGGDEGDSKVIRHITQMAHELNMKVCMEGVESESDIEKLSVYEPDKYQGFYFGRPSTAVQFREHHLRPDAQTEVYRQQVAGVNQ